jgi:hypothetical protein
MTSAFGYKWRGIIEIAHKACYKYYYMRTSEWNHNSFSHNHFSLSSTTFSLPLPQPFLSLVAEEEKQQQHHILNLLFGSSLVNLLATTLIIQS